MSLSSPPVASQRRTTPMPLLIPSDPAKGLYFTSPQSERDLRSLIRQAHKVIVEAQKGQGGPIPICQASRDTYSRFINQTSRSYRFSWGIGINGEELEVKPSSDEDAMGWVVFWGDPDPEHEGTINWVKKQVDESVKGWVVTTSGSRSCALTQEYQISRSSYTSTIEKEPDECWTIDGGQVLTALEVAWQHESPPQLVQEVDIWSRAGHNCLAIKLWWTEGTANTSCYNAVPFSALVVSQPKDSLQRQIWRFGSTAEKCIVKPSSRYAPPPIEMKGNIVSLPGSWFTLDRTAPDASSSSDNDDQGQDHDDESEEEEGDDDDDEPPPVILCLSSLALRVQRERANGSPSELQRMQGHLGNSQAIIADLDRRPSSLPDELRQRLLNKETKHLRHWNRRLEKLRRKEGKSKSTGASKRK